MNIDETSVEGIGFEITWGFQITQQLRNNPQNVVIPIGDCELEGFTYDLFTEYKQPSVRRTAENGRITVKAPVSGDYYPAVMLYDGAGKEAFRLSIEGEEKGVITAEWDDNRTYVFVLKESVSFRGGEEIKLETLTSEGTYRTEDMLLLKEKPAPRQHCYEITRMEARPREDGLVAITCITNWDVVAKVEYGPSSDYGETVSEKEAVNNHRLIIADLEPDRLYHYRIVAETDEGEVVVTPDATFSTKPKELAPGKPKIMQIPLT
nr:fibronectin type III domain-containing protein [bacterium]